MPGTGELGPCPHCRQLHSEDILLCPNTEKLLPLEGRILDGKFRFTRQLGEGGMGAVFQAENVLVKKTVAIKVMHVQFSRDEGVLARFRNEATAAGRIGSKYICDILDLGKSQLGPYIVMEMLKGQDFAVFVQKNAPVDYGTVVMIVRQALCGLEAAHAAGIVHRDLKPENIFLHQPEPGQLLVKLMDFGISKFTEGNEAGKTGMGVLMGTPEYMSPEQTEGAAQVDLRTDIWAMGVILYWALTGKNPFMGPTMAATLMNVSMREAPPLQQLVPSLPPELVQVVERCLRKNPDERWASCTQLRAALEPFEDLHNRFFVPYASRAGTAAAVAARTPPPGGTVASSGPPPGMVAAPVNTPLPSPASAGPTFSNELGGVPATGQPTLAGGFSGVDDDYGRPQSNMGGGIGGIIAIAVVAVLLVGGGGYFIWQQATQEDRIADVSTTPPKSDEGGEVEAKGDEGEAKAKADVGEAKSEKLDAGAAVGAEGAAEAGEAEAGAAEAGAAEAGAAEAGGAEDGKADDGAGADEGGEADEGAEEGPAEEGGEEGGGDGGSSTPSAKKGGSSSSSGAKKGSSSGGGAKKGGGSGGGSGGDKSGGDKSGGDKSGSDKSGSDKSGSDKSLVPKKPPRDEKNPAGGGDKKGGEKKKKKGKKAAKKAAAN